MPESVRKSEGTLPVSRQRGHCAGKPISYGSAGASPSQAAPITA